MKLKRRLAAWGCLLSVGMLAILVVTTGSLGQEEAKAPVQRADSDTIVRVINLQQVSSSQLVPIMERLFVDQGKLVIESDDRTNSLIVCTSRELMKKVEDSVIQLDRPGREDESVVKVFHLMHSPVGEIVDPLATLTGGLPGLAIASDIRTNSVIVRGLPADLEIVSALLQRLDVPGAVNPSATPDQFRVRVIWLVSGVQDKDLPAPPAEMQDVVEQLKPLGIDQVRMAGQVVVQASASSQFQATGKTVLNNETVLTLAGRVDSGDPLVRDSKENGSPMVTIEISAKDLAEQGALLSELSTKVAAPLGHRVVLGMAPVGELTSVFVIQVDRP